MNSLNWIASFLCVKSRCMVIGVWIISYCTGSRCVCIFNVLDRWWCTEIRIVSASHQRCPTVVRSDEETVTCNNTNRITHRLCECEHFDCGERCTLSCRGVPPNPPKYKVLELDSELHPEGCWNWAPELVSKAGGGQQNLNQGATVQFQVVQFLQWKNPVWVQDPVLLISSIAIWFISKVYHLIFS